MSISRERMIEIATAEGLTVEDVDGLQFKITSGEWHDFINPNRWPVSWTEEEFRQSCQDLSAIAEEHPLSD